MSFAISINPIYLCNFRCPFCYLTPNQLKDKQRLELADLRDRLEEIAAVKQITHIELYGGEVTLLDDSYVLTMIDLIRDYYNGTISVITNLSRIPDWFYNKDINVSVSWDYTAREQYLKVLDNMIAFNKPFHVLMLASQDVINWHDGQLFEAIALLNNMPKVTSIEVKPYSTNQANQQSITYLEFEHFMKRWLTLSPAVSRSYDFINEDKIKAVINKEGHAYSDDHIYITPAGHFAVLEFDHHDNEYFMPVYTMDDYFKWADGEKTIHGMNATCGICEFKGKCLSEHLRVVHDYEKRSCSGFKGLIEWYQNTS